MNLKENVYIYFNSTTQRCPNKIIKTFEIEDFFYLPPVSLTLAVLELRISPWIFGKMWKSLWGTQGLTGNWFMKNTWSRESRGTVPLTMSPLNLLNVSRIIFQIHNYSIVDAMDRLDTNHFTTVGKSMAVGNSPNLGHFYICFIAHLHRVSIERELRFCPLFVSVPIPQASWARNVPYTSLSNSFFSPSIQYKIEIITHSVWQERAEMVQT